MFNYLKKHSLKCESKFTEKVHIYPESSVNIWWLLKIEKALGFLVKSILRLSRTKIWEYDF